MLCKHQLLGLLVHWKWVGKVEQYLSQRATLLELCACGLEPKRPGTTGDMGIRESQRLQ